MVQIIFLVAKLTLSFTKMLLLSIFFNFALSMLMENMKYYIPFSPKQRYLNLKERDKFHCQAGN